MKSRNNLLLGLMAGAGFALGYWVNSKNGRKKIKQWSESASDLADAGLEQAEEILNSAAGKTTDLLDKSIELAEMARERTSEPVSLGSFSSTTKNGSKK